MEREFGAWLEQRRKALDLTREMLAKKASISVAMLRKIESGERKPSRELALALAEAVDIPSGHRERFLQFARSEGDSSGLEVQPAMLTAVPTPATGQPNEATIRLGLNPPE
jgi:transcriptional regulator with XRE-family HTH domain